MGKQPAESVCVCYVLSRAGVKVRVYTTAEDTAANGAGGGGAEQKPGSLRQKGGSFRGTEAANGAARAGSDGAEAVILSRLRLVSSLLFSSLLVSRVACVL